MVLDREGTRIVRAVGPLALGEDQVDNADDCDDSTGDIRRDSAK